MSYPATPFGHLQRLTDNIGLLQHSDGVVPLHGHGYRVEDIARGLLVVCREPSPAQELVVLGRRYLYFLAQAQALGGKFRNELGYDRRWHDEPGTEDGWGCSLWALGTAAMRGPTAGIREESLIRFNRGARVTSAAPRAMACAALGAAEILDKQPGHPGALALLYRASIVIGEPPADPAWPWPAPRLGCGSAAIAEAVIVCGSHLANDRMLGNGLRMLEWLLATETRNGHLSVVSPQGWGPGESRPAPDQRPTEVAALADACMRAAGVTGEDKWLTGVGLSVGWFLGDNDARVALLDDRTGGCSDSLTSDGRSRNQGAEATLAMISALQQGHRMADLSPGGTRLPPGDERLCYCCSYACRSDPDGTPAARPGLLHAHEPGCPAEPPQLMPQPSASPGGRIGRLRARRRRGLPDRPAGSPRPPCAPRWPEGGRSPLPPCSRCHHPSKRLPSCHLVVQSLVLVGEHGERRYDPPPFCQDLEVVQLAEVVIHAPSLLKTLVAALPPAACSASRSDWLTGSSGA
jgi:hypothetical protein